MLIEENEIINSKNIVIIVKLLCCKLLKYDTDRIYFCFSPCFDEATFPEILTKIRTVNIKTNILRRIPVKIRMNKNLGAARML